MKYEELVDFIEKRMAMSRIYQTRCADIYQTR
jgi:hypothetical protein